VEEARSSRVWRRFAIVGLGVLLGSLQGACGGSTPSAPTAPSPGPVNAGFLHVLQDDSVVTYDIDAATGRLRQSATQSMEDVHTLTGEPQGRYVYAAYGPRSARPPYDEPDPSIVAYAPDPLSGRLMTLSEMSSRPIWHSSRPVTGGWYWLSASSTRVYAVWQTVTYHDVYHTYVTHAVGNEGQLGPAHQEDFDEWDPEPVAVDVDADVFFKGTWTGGLTAHFVEPDGRLTQMGGSRLCVASTVDNVNPLVAVGGFLFASGYVGPGTAREKTVCSWEGPRLAPRANLGLQSHHAVAIAPRVSTPSPASRPATLVAMEMDVSTRGEYEVRLFAMSHDGDLEPLERITGPGWVRHLLFHPSGRFLYVSHAATSSGTPARLTVYSIDPQGRLEVVQTLEDGGGAMAVTG
jgi:hypothetical protein